MRAGPPLWIAGLGAILAFAATQLEVTHSITHFMPRGEDADLLSLSSRLASSERARTTILSISVADGPGGHEELLADAASRLAREIEALPGVQKVISGLERESLEALYTLYFPRRHYLVSATPERDVPALFTPEALAVSARTLRAGLAGPRASLIARVAPADPMSLFMRMTERVRGDAPELAVRNGAFVTRDGRHAIVFAEGRFSPLDSDHERPLQRGIAAAFEKVAAEIDTPLVLEQAGIGRIALATEATVRGDLQRIGTLSLLGVSALFLLLFRSPRGLVLAIGPALAGFATACTLGILLVGRVHGATLAFGASLVGIAVDYSIHLLNHHTLLPAAGGTAAVLRRLRPSLMLGAGTTLAGFAGFALTSFPGVREMGLFTMAGIAAALVVTLFGLPVFLRSVEPPSALQRHAARTLGRWTAVLRRRRGVLFGLALAAALLAGGTTRLEWQDDPRLLTVQDPVLLAEDARVRARVSRVESGRFVVALSDDEETTLARNDEVWRRLQGPIAAGALGGVQSLHELVPSRALQQRNLAAFRAIGGLDARVERAFRAEGFAPGAFAGFERALATPEAAPVRLEDLDGTPLAPTRDSMWVDLGGRFAAITYLRGVRDAGAAAAAVDGIPGVHFFDERALLEELYGSYRRKTVDLIAIGCACVLVLLSLRYRRWRPTLAAFVPSVLVIGAVLGLFGWLGTPMNLIGLASLLLILGIGVDYGIFIVDTADAPDHLAATMLSVLASCLTTLLVFGTLALSSQPALRVIGMTTGFGVLLGFVLAPTALLLVGDASEPSPPERGDRPRSSGVRE
jgi:predicted exporter